MPKNKGKKKQNQSVNPSSSVVVYKGPPTLPGSKGEVQMTTMVFGLQVSVVSGIAGAMQLVYTNSPSSSADFTSAAPLYDEYRVLSMMLKYFPTNRYSKTTTNCRPAVGYVDRDDVTIPSSYSIACKKGSAKIRSLEDPWTEVIKMNGQEDAVFTTTATLTTSFSYKLYADGLALSTEYGMMFIDYLVQFRGRGTI